MASTQSRRHKVPIASGTLDRENYAITFLFPLWTMIDGPWRGLQRCWIYFVMSLFTSFGFSMGMYLAAQERQVRWIARPK